jgi:putative molybdopterin biosynthesis protein
MAVVTFARWEEGFVVAPGNPKNIRGAEDLPRKNVTLINREPGSGSRALLDSLIDNVSRVAKEIRGYDHVAFGHLSAAHAVLAGEADCCIATRSAAQTFGLDFVPLRSEQYDFVLHRETFRMAAVEALCDALQRASLRRKLETLAGYDTSQTGVVRA